MRFNFDVLMVPAETLPGVWVALCPRLGLCTQGSSPTNAREMMEEAIALAFEDDEALGFDTLARERHDAWWDQWRAQIEEVRLRGVSVDLTRAGAAPEPKRLLVMVSIDQGQPAHEAAGADLRLCG
jgi:predicted RNase H-like HicB family nuclease